MAHYFLKLKLYDLNLFFLENRNPKKEEHKEQLNLKKEFEQEEKKINDKEDEEEEDEGSEENEEDEENDENEDEFKESDEYLKYEKEEENKRFEEKYKNYLSVFTDENIIYMEDANVNEENDVDLSKKI